LIILQPLQHEHNHDISERALPLLLQMKSIASSGSSASVVADAVVLLLTGYETVGTLITIGDNDNHSTNNNNSNDDQTNQ